jgi:hypothetical protein
MARGQVTIGLGGGPSDDKPGVTLETPSNRNRASGFLNIRVADINAVYEQWRRRGAEFLTPPIDRGVEIRCYMRDPDGHLIGHSGPSRPTVVRFPAGGAAASPCGRSERTRRGTRAELVVRVDPAGPALMTPAPT